MSEDKKKDEITESESETKEDTMIPAANDESIETSTAPAATAAKKSIVHTVAFKCVIVLLIIVIVCGVFLTLCNALFYVSDQERTDRAAKKIYDGEEVTTIALEVDEDIVIDKAKINLVYRIEEHPDDYLVNVTGREGYSGGTVTCYVVITVTDGEISVGNISVSENTNQSLMSNVKSSYLEGFSELYGTETDETGDYYMLWNEENGFYVEKPGSVGGAHLTTGATYTMQAICNAVNGAVTYVNLKYVEGQS